MVGKTIVTFHCPLQDANISCLSETFLLVHNLKLSIKDPEYKRRAAQQRRAREMQIEFSVKLMNL